MINQLAIKKILFPSLLILQNILKKVENPQRLELRVGLRRCWGEELSFSSPEAVISWSRGLVTNWGEWLWAWEWEVVEWHLHYSMRGMWQTISRHCSLRQRKRRENAYIKSLVLTVQASCCWIQTIEVSCLYFSTFLILILFSLFNYFLDRYHKYVDC